MNITPQEAMKIAAEFVRQKRKFFGERVFFIGDGADDVVGLGIIDAPGKVVPRLSGTIVAVGCDVKLEKYDIKVGDRVLHTRYQPGAIVLTRDDGSDVTIMMVHPADIYVGWDDPELRELFLTEQVRLGLVN